MSWYCPQILLRFVMLLLAQDQSICANLHDGIGLMGPCISHGCSQALST